jgi:hypothetical protein
MGEVEFDSCVDVSCYREPTSLREAELGDLKAAYMTACISANCCAYEYDRLTTDTCTCCGSVFFSIIMWESSMVFGNQASSKF